MIIIYTDGSYKDHLKTGTWAYTILKADEATVINEASGKVTESNLLEMWNVGGEIKAVVEALRYLNNNTEYTGNVIVKHDLMNIGKWARGEFKAKKEAVKRFLQFLEAVEHRGLYVVFEHVKGHSHIRWNEYVDRLCESAYA